MHELVPENGSFLLFFSALYFKETNRLTDIFECRAGTGHTVETENHSEAQTVGFTTSLAQARAGEREARLV